MKEKHQERPLPNIEYIAYLNGRAIARDEWGELYYHEIPEEYGTVGEVALLDDIKPISELQQEEQKKIREFLEME